MEAVYHQTVISRLSHLPRPRRHGEPGDASAAFFFFFFFFWFCEKSHFIRTLRLLQAHGNSRLISRTSISETLWSLAGRRDTVVPSVLPPSDALNGDRCRVWAENVVSGHRLICLSHE